MTRPIFDTAALWASLSPDQQRAIGVAAIDREITLHGRDHIDDRDRGGEFEELDAQADDGLYEAVEAVLDLEEIDADQFPLPSFAAPSTGA